MSSSEQPSATPSSTSCTNLYDTPVRDVACAMPYSEDNIQLMSSCCNDADVVSYYDDCGLYCLAVDQSVEDLTSCLFEGGAAWQDVFCRGNGTATATATGAGDIVPSASATVVSEGGSDSGDNNDDDGGDDSNGDSQSDGSSSNDDEGSATRTGFGVSGLLVTALVVSTALFGALG